MQPGYKHHVFISYSRSGDIPDWVHNHFFPVLKNRLDAVLEEEGPELYIDKQIEVGSDWPIALSDALRLSCCMVAIWSPSFFRSKWCLAEWGTMLAREERLGLKAPGRNRGLVYPVVFSGKSFPEEARRTQLRKDLSDYAYPYPQFSRSEKYLEFHDKMTEIAKDLAGLFRDVPPWDEDWPTIQHPTVKPPGPPQFSRL